VALRVIRHLDLAVLLLALPVFVAAGWPIGGWGAGSGIYLAQWVVRELTTRRAAGSKDPREVVGLLASLEREDLEAVHRHEQEGQARPQVLRAIEDLLGASQTTGPP
jgi:hypothetical protein